MADTNQAPIAADTVFNGRDFVPVDEPVGESPSPADGNDDGGDAPAAEDAPSEPVAETQTGTDDEQDDAPAADAGKPGKTFWDDTPEEKRAERFNRTMERQNQLSKELTEYKAKLAKYEAGEGPRPTKPAESEAPATAAADEPGDFDPEDYIGKAIFATDTANLSDTQKRIRGFHAEVVGLRKETVEPARAAFQKATEALSKANTTLERKRIHLEGLKEMAEGREGLYDSEIGQTEESIRKIELEITRAKSDHVNARLDLKEAEEKVTLRQQANLNKAQALAKQEGRKHQEAASQKTYDSDYKTEETRLAKVWTDDLKAVIEDLGIAAEDREDAEALAFARVKAEGDRRGDKNPVTEAEFKGLIKKALGRLATRSAADTGRSDAEIATARAAATAQPAPKKRTATTGDASPPSVEEAEKELLQTFRSARVRVRAA